MLPLRIAVDLLQPSPPIESSSPSDAHPLRPHSSSLHGPRLASRPRSPSRPFAFKERLQRSSSSQLPFARTLSDRFVSSDAPSHSRGLRSRGFPSPKHWNFHGNHLRNPRCGSHQGGHLRNTRCPRMGSAPWGSPSPMRIGFAS